MEHMEVTASWVWWWWVIACMMGWGGSSFLMGFAGRNLPYTHSFFYNTVGMVLGTALVLLAVEEGGGGHGGGGGSGHHGKAAREQHHGKPGRHVPSSSGDVEIDSLLGWRDGSMARLGVSVSVAGPVSGLYLTLPAVLGVLLLGEPLTLAKVVGLLLAMAAIYLLGSEDDAESGESAGDPDESSAVADRTESMELGGAKGDLMEESAGESSSTAAAGARRRDKVVGTRTDTQS